MNTDVQIKYGPPDKSQTSKWFRHTEVAPCEESVTLVSPFEGSGLEIGDDFREALLRRILVDSHRHDLEARFVQFSRSFSSDFESHEIGWFCHQETDLGEGTTLGDSLSGLDSIPEMVAEQGLEESPDQSTIDNARELIEKLHRLFPGRYHVSPTERRGVAIDAPMRSGGAVSIECGPNDVVYCFVAIDGNRRRAKFYQMDGVPDTFIKTALLDLAKG